jgi:putative membrane protein
MLKIANLLVGIVALVHIIVFVVEMFFWKQPVIHERLGFTLEEAIKVAPIVANAGLYNGFLAAGLIWGLVSRKNSDAIKIFFLACVIIAGIFGAVTLKWTTLAIQTVPGAIALFLVWISRSPANKHLDSQNYPTVAK